MHFGPDTLHLVWLKALCKFLFRSAERYHAELLHRRNFWQYFDIPRQYMPQNCSADVQAVIAYIDETFVNGTTEEIDAIETTFGMNLTHLDDFSYAREDAVR